MSLSEKILNLLKTSQRPLSSDELSKELSEDDSSLQEVLGNLTSSGRLHLTKRERYGLPGDLNMMVGRLDSTRQGAGFLVPETGEGEQADLFIPAHNLRGAVHGDLVMARVEKKDKGKDKKAEGFIVRVLERAHTRLVGTLEKSEHFGFVKPDHPRLKFDVYLPQAEIEKAEDRSKVVVEIEQWAQGDKSPRGRVVEALGHPEDPGVDVLSILYSYGLETDFPEDVERELRKLVVEVEKEVPRRLDLREITTLTIDPRDAQDFDDALSVESLEKELFRVGVHIADVSFLVTPGSAIDEEARRRGTSVYLVDRVVPMLPERLSNELCSLNPGEDRLAYSVLLTINGEAEIKEATFRETVIRSRCRLTYREAQGLLESEPAREELKSVLWEVQTLRRLAKALQKRRAQQGSLDFDLPTAVVELDEEGLPVKLHEAIRLDSMRLVEEFMLAANVAVAERAAEAKIPFLYRVHERPPEDKVEKVTKYLAALGYDCDGEPNDPEFFASLLRQGKERGEEDLVQALVLRCMERAHYSTGNKGHFGLAARHYTHFTSPIRRYPDLEVHRRLKRLEACEHSEAEEEGLTESLQDLAEHCSARERVATDAERDSIDLKKVQFMERHLNHEFTARIASVKPFGLFLTLERYLVDGLLHVDELEDDYYEFQEEQYALIGRNRGRRFCLGDRLRVKIGSVDLQKGQIDFQLADSASSESEDSSSS